MGWNSELGTINICFYYTRNSGCYAPFFLAPVVCSGPFRLPHGGLWPPLMGLWPPANVDKRLQMVMNGYEWLRMVNLVTNGYKRSCIEHDRRGVVVVVQLFSKVRIFSNFRNITIILRGITMFLRTQFN